jgi:hypothetical protein
VLADPERPWADFIRLDKTSDVTREERPHVAE